MSHFKSLGDFCFWDIGDSKSNKFIQKAWVHSLYIKPFSFFLLQMWDKFTCEYQEPLYVWITLISTHLHMQVWNLYTFKRLKYFQCELIYCMLSYFLHLFFQYRTIPHVNLNNSYPYLANVGQDPKKMQMVCSSC